MLVQYGFKNNFNYSVLLLLTAQMADLNQRTFFCICSKKQLEWPKPGPKGLTSTQHGCFERKMAVSKRIGPFYPEQNSWTIVLENYKFYQDELHFDILGVSEVGNFSFLSLEGDLSTY